MTLLQLQGTADEVTKLTRSSIELAEAAANFGALKIIFGVFLVLMLVIAIVFIAQSTYILSKIKNISDASSKTMNYFDDLSEKSIGKDEASSIFREVVNHCAVHIKYSIVRIKTENNIENKKNTEIKIQRIIRNLYSENNSFLGKFLLRGKPLNLVLDIDSDSDGIFSLIWDQVYIPKDEFTLAGMDQSVDLFMQELKLNYINKLDSL